jgi:hypothetical protein
MFRKGGGKTSTVEEDHPEVDGTPVGRRTVLGLIALAGAGVVGGKAVQDGTGARPELLAGTPTSAPGATASPTSSAPADPGVYLGPATCRRNTVS